MYFNLYFCANLGYNSKCTNEHVHLYMEPQNCTFVQLGSNSQCTQGYSCVHVEPQHCTFCTIGMYQANVQMDKCTDGHIHVYMQPQNCTFVQWVATAYVHRGIHVYTLSFNTCTQGCQCTWFSNCLCAHIHVFPTHQLKTFFSCSTVMFLYLDVQQVAKLEGSYPCDIPIFVPRQATLENLL